MDMAIDRKNSFHLMLSDDELELLRLLAEQQGLNPSDYLRTLLRQHAGPGSHYLGAVLRLGEMLSAKPEVAKALASYRTQSALTDYAAAMKKPPKKAAGK
jgi:hypothetical protein